MSGGRVLRGPQELEEGLHAVSFSILASFRSIWFDVEQSPHLEGHAWTKSKEVEMTERCGGDILSSDLGNDSGTPAKRGVFDDETRDRRQSQSQGRV